MASLVFNTRWGWVPLMIPATLDTSVCRMKASVTLHQNRIISAGCWHEYTTSIFLLDGLTPIQDLRTRGRWMELLIRTASDTKVRCLETFSTPNDLIFINCTRIDSGSPALNKVEHVGRDARAIVRVLLTEVRAFWPKSTTKPICGDATLNIFCLGHIAISVACHPL